MILTEIVRVGDAVFVIAYTPCKTQYAFGLSQDEAEKRLLEVPRTPVERAPRHFELAGELIALGKLSDESRLRLLDHEAAIILEALV